MSRRLEVEDQFPGIFRYQTVTLGGLGWAIEREHAHILCTILDVHFPSGDKTLSFSSHFQPHFVISGLNVFGRHLRGS